MRRLIPRRPAAVVRAAALALALPSLSAGAQLLPYTRGSVSTVRDCRGGFVAAGTALRGTGGLGTIDLAGIPFGSTVKEAILYWAILASDPMPPGANSIQLDSQPFTGTLVGSSLFPGGPSDRAYVFRADVTYWITGDGSYGVSGALDGGDPDGSPVAEGASLVVLYSNPALVNRDIVVYDGAALVDGSTPAVLTSIGGFDATTPVTGASIAFIVADGEAALSDSTYVNGFLVGPDALDGSDAPGGIEFWDTDVYAVSGIMTGGSTSLSALVSQGDDDVVWCASPFAVASPLPAADILTESLTPLVPRGTNFRMRVTATNNTGSPVPVTANVDVYDAGGTWLGSFLSNRTGSLPASTTLQRSFKARIPAGVPPRFLMTPLYVVTSLHRRPGGEFLDDDHVVLRIE